MKAIILSAGQGSRLLPLTEGRPKCLLPLGSKTLLEWQIWALTQGGVDEIAVVVGYHAPDVIALLKRLESPRLTIRTVFNPFYKLADNLASCWLARHEMDQDFVILNGDTVIEPAIFQRLTASPAAPITVTIDKKDGYDSDDMKVHLKGTRLLDIGKTLPPDRTSHRQSAARRSAPPRERGARAFCESAPCAARRRGSGPPGRAVPKTDYSR